MPKFKLNGVVTEWDGDSITYEQIAELVKLRQPTVVVDYRVPRDHHLHGKDFCPTIGQNVDLVDGFTSISAHDTSGA